MNGATADTRSLISLGSQHCWAILLLSLVIFSLLFPSPLPHFISNLGKNVQKETKAIEGQGASSTFCPLFQMKIYLHVHPSSFQHEGSRSLVSRSLFTHMPQLSCSDGPPSPVHATVKRSISNWLLASSHPACLLY